MRASSVCLQGRPPRQQLPCKLGELSCGAAPAEWSCMWLLFTGLKPLYMIQLQPSTLGRDDCGKESWGGTLHCLWCCIVPGCRLCH